MKLFASFFMLLLFASPPVFGEPLLSLDSVDYRSGQSLTLTLAGVEAVPPGQLNCRLESVAAERTVVEVVAVAVPGKEGGAAQTYQLTVPDSIQGLVKLSVLEFDVTPVLFMVFKTDAVDRDTYPTLSSLYNQSQPYLYNISAYEPIYFLVGANPEKSKFQFSFKYRLFNPEGTLNKNLPWLQGLHLAFTQTSFWDLKSESTPFEDTSYKPELFLLTANAPFRPSGLDGLFFQCGYQHESNGRAEPESRSTNILYLKSFLVWYDETSRIGLGIAPKVWAYVDNDRKTNPDLSAYRGYFQIDVRVGKADGLVLGTDLRWATEGGSIQADLTYPVGQFLGDNLELYLQLQYVNALAESLISYQSRTEAFRVGIALVR